MQMDSADLVAVIDIGATAIRLVLAEIGEGTNWNIIENAGKPVPFGRDVFRSGKISNETMNIALRVLQGFAELLDGYAVSDKRIEVIATSALREARNRDTFVDRVAIKTGFRINTLEGIEENRLTYMAVQRALQPLQATLSRSNAFIIEVGGGSTELMVLRRGKVVTAHSLNIGTVRIEQQLRAAESVSHRVRYLEENIRNVRDVFSTEFELSRIRHFVAVGGDARLAAERVGEPVDPKYSVIKKPAFDEFVRTIDALTVDECVARLKIPYDQADSLSTGLLVYQLFMKGTIADELIVPQVSIRDGVLLSLVEAPSEAIHGEFDTQVLASANSIGQRYQFDSEHSRHVAKLSLSLFDQLTNEHGLDSHDRLLLQVSAILHDIGTFVKPSGHHKHGQYLVKNSDVFGLHADDLHVVANVVRYHRKSPPLSSHIAYMSLSREDRMKVLKLSAMLRIADALDRAHAQRIHSIQLEMSDVAIVITCDYRGDMSIERYGLVSKGKMFEDVFGMEISIAQPSGDGFV